jgi:hypothetical protein
MSPKLASNSSLPVNEMHIPSKARRQSGGPLHRSSLLFRSNARRARAAWGALPKYALETLKKLTETHCLDVAGGELQFLNNRWYVTNAGLLQIARRNRCAGIRTVIEKGLSDPATSRWVFRATVYKSPRSRGFVGYGDADPSNVSSLVHGAEMRVAETRAVNRALRKAYGIGLCSVEELGTLSGPPTSSLGLVHPNRFHAAGPSTNGHHPRLRDQLCLLIRQHNLDPALVKAYAADFCGTQTLKDASRDLVESFISHIAKAAKEDRDALVCKLNSYSQPAEANP